MESNLCDLWFGNAQIISQLHKDGPIQTTSIEHHLVILLDQRISQHLQLFVGRKRRDRPDHAAGQRLSVFPGSKSDTISLEIIFNAVEIHAAITGDIRKAIDVFLFRQSHLQRHGFDGLLDAVAADLRDQFRPPFGFMLKHTIDCTFVIKQITKLLMDVIFRKSRCHEQDYTSLKPFILKGKRMPISSDHHNLFHQSGTADKISQFESLLQAHDLNGDEALALLKSIHTDLEQPQGHDHTVYASYAHMLEALHHEMPNVHQHVLANWQTPKHADTEEESVDDEVEEAESDEGESEARNEDKRNQEDVKESEAEETEVEEAEEEESEAEEESEEEGEEEGEGEEEAEDESEESEEEGDESEEEAEESQEDQNEEEGEEEESEEEGEEEQAEESEEETEESEEEAEEEEEGTEESEEIEEAESESEGAEGGEAEESEAMATEAAEAAGEAEHEEAEGEEFEENESGMEGE